MYSKILAFLFSFFTVSSSLAQNSVTLSADKFAELLRNVPDAQLIDLRPADEFAAGHIRKAKNYDFLNDDFEKTALKNIDRKKPVYLYCFTGVRSRHAAQFLKDLGYDQIYDLEGGFAKWTYSSKPYVSGSAGVKPFAVFTEENFNLVISTNNIVLVDFYNSSCNDCKKMLPVYEKIKAENSYVKLLRINTEHNELMVEKFDIDQTPTLIIFKYGRQVWRNTGEMPEKDIKTIIEK